MSEPVRAKLPRFDTPSARPSAEMLGALLGKPEEAPAAPVPEQAAPEPVAVEAPPPPPPPPPPPVQETVSLAEVETLTAELSRQIDGLDARMRADVTAIVQAMAEKLFPKLSRLFLAEEIGRHLPELVPVSIPRLEITASPELAEQLGPVVQRSQTLAQRCTIIETGKADSGRVEVSWHSGGLTFDFNGLMEACLAELESI